MLRVGAPAKAYGALVATTKFPPTEAPEIVTVSVEIVSVEVKLSLEVVEVSVAMLEDRGFELEVTALLVVDEPTKDEGFELEVVTLGG